MKEILIALLETFCPDNVFLQGTLNPDEVYPETFITFYVADSDFDAYYDNDPNKINWYVHVVLYSSNPANILSMPSEIISALRTAGFMPQNAGIDVISNIQTHTGWAMEFIYQENTN